MSEPTRKPPAAGAGVEGAASAMAPSRHAAGTARRLPAKPPRRSSSRRVIPSALMAPPSLLIGPGRPGARGLYRSRCRPHLGPEPAPGPLGVLRPRQTQPEEIDPGQDLLRARDRECVLEPREQMEHLGDFVPGFPGRCRLLRVSCLVEE